MFEINETVKHNVLGICFIKDITEFEDKKYYILYQNDNRTKIMIPINNSEKIIRKILTKDEVDSLIKKIPDIEVCSIDNYKDRNKEYEKLLKSGEAGDLAKLIKTIDEEQKTGKVLTLADKEKFKTAEKLLYEEFGFSLNIQRDEVKKYILDTIK